MALARRPVSELPPCIRAPADTQIALRSGLFCARNKNFRLENRKQRHRRANGTCFPSDRPGCLLGTRGRPHANGLSAHQNPITLQPRVSADIMILPLIARQQLIGRGMRLVGLRDRIAAARSWDLPPGRRTCRARAPNSSLRRQSKGFSSLKPFGLLPTSRPSFAPALTRSRDRPIYSRPGSIDVPARIRSTRRRRRRAGINPALSRSGYRAPLPPARDNSRPPWSCRQNRTQSEAICTIMPLLHRSACATSSRPGWSALPLPRRFSSIPVFPPEPEGSNRFENAASTGFADRIVRKSAPSKSAEPHG